MRVCGIRHFRADSVDRALVFHVLERSCAASATSTCTLLTVATSAAAIAVRTLIVPLAASSSSATVRAGSSPARGTRTMTAAAAAAAAGPCFPIVSVLSVTATSHYPVVGPTATTASRPTRSTPGSAPSTSGPDNDLVAVGA